MGPVTRRWPAEWEPHEATLLTWPWFSEVWGTRHEGAQHTMARAAAELSHVERVHIYVPAPAWVHGARARLDVLRANHEQVHFVVAPSDDVWVRDHGPTYVHDGGARVAVDWNFNAWGDKYRHERDARLAAIMGDAFADRTETSGITLEGGALETDGRGTVITTRSVALTESRNPGVNTGAIEAELAARLGATDVLWLEAGMQSDDTDGHVDTLARFVTPERVLVHTLSDPTHADHAALEANAAYLATRFEVVRLPCAPCEIDGEPAPASYANFYLANDLVLAPTYGLSTDDAALRIIDDATPGRTTVPIDCRALLSQGGAIHCATQQVPAAP